MNNQPTPGGSPNNASSYSEAIARELDFLRQTLNQLAATERDLESQRMQLQEQITRYTEQAPAAQRMNRPDLAAEAMARVAQLQPELARVQQHLALTVARQREITNRQFDLLRQTSALGSAPGAFAPLQPFKPSKPKKRRRVLIGLSISLIVIVLASLGLSQMLRATPGKPAISLVQTQTNPSPTATPSPTPTPLPPVPAFHPDGTGPTNQQCLNALGAPCYSPEQIQQAFGLTALYKEGYDGAGQTIVILGTGKTTTLKADLHHFDQTWGLPDPPHFQIIDDATPAPYSCPDKQDDLQIENTLDVEWAHAIAPGANIVMMVGSNSPPGGNADDSCYFYGLSDTLNDALNNPLGQVVSISYGGSELGSVGETAAQKDQEAQFYEFEDGILQPAVTSGITVLAATGDNGVTNPDGSNNPNAVWQHPNVSWPASDPYVLAVGGTTLHIQNASGTYGSEQVWNDGAQGGASGGGLSAIFPAPDYQYGLINQELLHNKRGIPDVSFPAQPSYDLYASFETGIMGQVNPGQWKHWDIIGGTSIATPCWAGLIAIANQMYGKPIGFVQPALYLLHGKGMHDITSGNNSYGGVSGYSALPGYDLASGWGTPIANQFVPDLIEALESPDHGCPGYRKPCG